MKNKIILYLGITLVCYGCKTSVKDEMITDINLKYSNNRTSLISLKEITKFKWDKMYFFPDWTTTETITNTIGFNYTGTDVQDDYSRMLFVYGKKVVYEEDFQSFTFNNISIDFKGVSDSLSKAKPYYLTSIKATFSIKANRGLGSCKDCIVYTLTPIR